MWVGTGGSDRSLITKDGMPYEDRKLAKEDDPRMLCCRCSPSEEHDIGLDMPSFAISWSSIMWSVQDGVVGGEFAP